MDHPDFPVGFKLPKKKKPSSNTSSSSKSTSKNKSSRSPPPPLPSGTPWSGPSSASSFATHPAVTPLQPGAHPQQHNLGYSWTIHPQEEYRPERSSSLLAIRTPKLLRGKTTDRQQEDRNDGRNPGSNYRSVSPFSSASINSAADSAKSSSSQPSTPSWPPRGVSSTEEQSRFENPLPPLPFQKQQQQQQQQHQAQSPPQDCASGLPPGFDAGEDLALFAAATAGLSPDPASRSGAQARVHRPQASSSSSSHHRNASISSGRQPSTSSSSAPSQRALSIPSLAPDVEARTGLGLYNMPKSAPDLPTTRDASHRRPSGHSSGLTRWATQSSISSTQSVEPREEYTRTQSGSRSLEVPRHSISPQTSSVPLPPQSLDLPRPLASHPQIRGPSPPRPSTSIRRPSPPPSEGQPSPISEWPDGSTSGNMPWLQDNVSALSIDTTISRAQSYQPGGGNARMSAVSALSGLGDLDDEVSPLDPEDADLPNYVQSQEEMAQRRQLESARRAQELQRRWMASTGR